MGNCCEKQALKIIVEGRNGPKAYFLTTRQLRNIRTYGDLFSSIHLSTAHFKYMYSIVAMNEVQFLRLSSDFKIKNLLLCTDTEYHISFEKLYCL